MSRSGLTWAAVGLLLLAAGCTMCAHPYDKCGPVYGDGSGSNCCPMWRMNSVLGPGGPGGAAMPAEAVPTGIPTRAANPPGMTDAPLAAVPEGQQPATMRRVPVQSTPPSQSPPY